MSTEGGSKKDLLRTIRYLQDENQKLRESAIPPTVLLAAVKCEEENLKPKESQDGKWAAGYGACLNWVKGWVSMRTNAANRGLQALV